MIFLCNKNMISKTYLNLNILLPSCYEKKT